MSTIDHAAEAERFAAWADNPSLPPENVSAISSMAQMHATLALVEQQHIANMQTERSALRARAIGRHDDVARQYLADAADLDGKIREALGLS